MAFKHLRFVVPSHKVKITPPPALVEMKLPWIVAIAHVALVAHVASGQVASDESRMITMPLIPHHVQRQRRLDAAAQDPFTLKADALYQGYGTHYVDLWVGTPPQRQTLIIDTGSSVTAFPCSDCSNCGSGYHIDDYFQEKNSATCVEVECSDCTIGHCTSSSQCELSVSYQEGSSWNAYEVKDKAYTGGPHSTGIDHAPHAFEFHFGCQTHLTGLFKTQLADGIAGMEVRHSLCSSFIAVLVSVLPVHVLTQQLLSNSNHYVS